MKITELVPGTKLELELYNEDGETIKPAFVSEVEWAVDDDNAVIAAPIHEGIIYPVPVGAYMDIFFSHKVKDIGLFEMYKFTALVKGRKVIDNIAILEIKLESDFEKVQRRQFFRFECSIPVRYRQSVTLNKEHNTGIPFEKAVTRDLSGGGLCFVTNEKLDMNKVLEMEVSLSEEDTRSFFGTIVRVSKLDKEEKFNYEIGIVYKKIENWDREAIIKFIFTEQRKLRKKGLI